MKPLNEQTISRLQKLAGINEIRVANPYEGSFDLDIGRDFLANAFRDLVSGRMNPGVGLEAQAKVTINLNTVNEPQEYTDAVISDMHVDDGSFASGDTRFFLDIAGINKDSEFFDKLVKFLDTQKIKWEVSKNVSPEFIIIHFNKKAAYRFINLEGKPLVSVV